MDRQVKALQAQVAELKQELADLRALRADDEPWYWQREGNDLDSMSDGMVIRILAGQLRELLDKRIFCEDCGAEVPEGQGLGFSLVGLAAESWASKPMEITPLCRGCVARRITR